MTDWSEVARRATQAAVAEVQAATAELAASGVKIGRRAPAGRPVESEELPAYVDEVEAQHLRSGLLSRADVEETARGRLEIARLGVARVEGVAAGADEAARIARGAANAGLSRLAEYERAARSATVDEALEALADPAPMDAARRDHLERIVAVEVSARQLDKRPPLLSGEPADRLGLAADHVRAAGEFADEAEQAARRAQEIAGEAERRLAPFTNGLLSSGELELLEADLAGDMQRARREQTAAKDAAAEALERVRDAERALQDGATTTEGAR